jgi:hypothetical protein
MATSKYLKAAKENLAKKGYKKYNTSGGESKLKKDLSVVNGDYINSFIKDADSFIESSRASYDTSGYDTTPGIYEKYKKDASDLDERAKRIRAYTRVYGGNLDKEAADNINKILSAWSESKVALSSAFEEKSSFISSVKDADEYDSAMRNAGYMTKYGNMSRAEREKALNDLKVGRAEDGKSRGDDKALDSEIDFLEYYGIRQGYDTSAEYDEEIRALEGEIQAIKDLRAKDAEELKNASTVRDTRDSLRRQNIYATESEKVRELENKIGALTVGRDDAKKREELYAEYGKYTESPDFEEGSRYVSTVQNLSDEEIAALGYKKDKTGEWYKDVGLGGVEYYDPAGDMVYEYINADDATQNDMMLSEKAEMYALGNVMYNEDVVKTSRYKTYGEMSEEEVKIYNYLYQNSPEDAKAYLDTLSPTLDKRFDAKETQRLAEIGHDNWAGGSLISIASNLGSGLFAPAKVTADLFGADGSKFDSSSRVTSALRQGAGQKWAEGLDFDVPLIQKNAGEFVYNSLMSIADMGVALGLGLGAGGSAETASKITQFIMSSEAASSEIYSAHEDGLSGVEAAARGVLAGAIEAITEKYSIENLLGDPKGIVKGVLTQAFTEATEETSATLLNTAVDVIASEIAGHANEFESNIYKLMSEGMTSEEAEKETLMGYLRDLGTDALAGALTGAVMGGTKEISSTITERVSRTPAPTTPDIDVDTPDIDGDVDTPVDTSRAESTYKGAYTVSVKDGKYTLSMPDGDGTVTAIEDADIDSNSIERMVLDLAKKQKMTPATAQKLLNDYDSSTNADNYIEEADYVYSMGKSGVPMAEVSRGAGLLSTASREMLYTDGAEYTREIETRRTKAYNKLREATSGVITRGSFDTTNIKGVRLNASQERNVRFAEALSSLGFNIKVVRGVASNKKAIGAYNPKTGVIEVDIDSMKKRDVIGAVRGQFMNTLSHEITHQMRNASAELYAQYRDIVLGGFSEGGNLDSLLEKEIDRLQRTGRYKGKNRADLLDIATDEIVARASENMLRDSDAIQRVIEENRSVGEKILEVITNIVEKLKSLLKEFEGEDSVSEEANLLREMTKVYEEAKAKWSEAFADTVKNISAAREAVEMKGESAFTEDGEMVYESSEDGSIRFNEATYDEEGRDKLRVFLEKQVKNKQLSNEDAADILTSLEDIYDTIHEFRDKFAPYGEWAEAKVIRDGKGNPVFSVVTPNGEYAMNIDFSLVCKKRRMLDAVFNRMIKRGVVDDFALGKEEIVKINDIIKSHGFEIACALCFVDAKRFRQAGVADSFVEIYNGIINEITPEGVEVPYFNFGGNSKLNTEGDGLKNVKVDNSVFDRYVKEYGAKSVPGRVAKYLKTHPADRKLLSRGDFISTAGFDAVRTQKPDILKLFNAKKGSGGPKSAFSDTQYLNEIIERSAFNAAKAFLVGGVRVQSFSDYIPRLVFDYCQMIADLSAKKLPAHAYSKESLFVKQFGKTGIKINMSLIPKMADGGVAAGLDADGNYAWADESFDFETAKAIQDADGYTDNCGTICVGVSTEHILKLLADPNIRMVIPYHKSGLNPIVAKMNKIEGFTDYTNFQNTRYKNADGTTGSKLTKADLKTQPNVNDLMQKGMDAKEAAQAYLDWCDENGYVPKFDEFRGNPNYYKLLIDFVAYNKNGVAVPQGAVKMNFPNGGDAFGSMASLIEEGLEADAVTQFAQNEALDPIVDEIEKVLGEGEVLYSEYNEGDDIRQSISDTTPTPRETLVDALAETAQNDAERNVLAEYKVHAREIDGYNAELNEINAELKRLSFGKGKRDTARIAELKDRKAVLEKKIQRADKKLLNLESTKPLRDVLLRREKQLRTQKADALKKAREEAKAATAAELEKIVKEQREVIKRLNEKAKRRAADAVMTERWTNAIIRSNEMFKKEAEIADIKRRAAEREIERRKASARNKVKDRAKNLISYITNQTDKKNVKEGIKGAAVEFMRVILRDTGMFTPSEMGRLRDAYSLLKDKEDTPGHDIKYKGTYDFEIMKDIESLSKTVSGKAWRDLTLEELEAVDRVTSNLRTMIRKENKIFREGRAEDRLALAEAEKADIDAADKRRHGKSKLIKMLGTENFTPFYFFKRLGGTMWKLFKDVINGQHKAAREYEKARKKLDSLKEKYNFKEWKNTKAKTFKADSGTEFSLTVGQMMYIYAAHKRETLNKDTKSKTNHLLGGGIFVGDTIDEIKDSKGKDIKDKEDKTIRLSDDLLLEIIGSLTDEQKAMADALVEYLSVDMSALGNEVSMQLYGINKFHEKYYIPFSVYSGALGKNSIDAAKAGKDVVEAETKLKHMGSTNAITTGASEALLAEDIFDIWSEHVVEMVNYSSFVLPIEAFESVLNFNVPDEDGSLDEDGNRSTRMGELFRLKYGNNALNYLNNFMRDLNGGIVRSQKTGTEKLISYAKKNAVAANLSVVIQQPTAIIRAMAVIDPKYLATVRGGDSSKKNPRETWEEMKQYAPGVTVIKEMGRFDIGSGAAAKEYIHSDKSLQTLKDKAGAVQEWVDDKLGLGAEWGDKIAWIQIWRACKAEISDKQGLTGEALLEAAGKRFTEVINKTQVYDSILVRSGHMRNTNPIAVMTTAYKSESTLTLNLLADALASKSGKVIARTAAVFLVQALVTSAIKSLAYAARDDDEDKTYLEKYLAEFSTSFVDDVTIVGGVPYLADIVSIFKGYDVTRMDMDIIKDIADSYNKVMEDDPSAGDWGSLMLNVASIFGVPAKNIWRDIQIIPNMWKHAKGTSKEGIGYAIGEAFASGTLEKTLNKFGFSFSPANYAGYMNALEDGDTKKARDIQKDIIEYKVTKAQRKAEAKGERFKRSEAEDDARSSIQSRLTRRYKSAYIAAYERKDTDEMARIKAILRRSGVYKKNISDICRGWVKDN